MKMQPQWCYEHRLFYVGFYYIFAAEVSSNLSKSFVVYQELIMIACNIFDNFYEKAPEN